MLTGNRRAKNSCPLHVEICQSLSACQVSLGMYCHRNNHRRPNGKTLIQPVLPKLIIKLASRQTSNKALPSQVIGKKTTSSAAPIWIANNKTNNHLDGTSSICNGGSNFRDDIADDRVYGYGSTQQIFQQ